MSLDRPLLITGTPRSGKTCVWNVLLKAPGFAMAHEPLMIWDSGITGREDDRWTKADVTEDAVRRVTRKCEALVRRNRADRYLDILSHHCIRLPYIAEVMPNARVIHVLRDPMGCVPESFFGWTNRDTIRRSIAWRWRNIDPRSLPRMVWRFTRNYARSRVKGVRETWGPRVPGLADYVRDHSAAEIAAWQWARTVEIALDDIAALPDLAVLEVRHDQLVTSPAEQARRIADFAGIPDAEPIAEFAAEYLKRDYVHHEPCRREPSAEDWARILPLIDPLRVRLGYREADPA